MRMHPHAKNVRYSIKKIFPGEQWRLSSVFFTINGRARVSLWTYFLLKTESVEYYNFVFMFQEKKPSLEPYRKRPELKLSV